MEPDEVTLSEVHVYGPSLLDDNTHYKDYQVGKTRFVYSVNNDDPEFLKLSSEPGSDKLVPTKAEVDEDGDLIIQRKSKTNVEVITIEHTMATRLSDVGLQVWQGCLLLCDYILDNAAIFKDAVVLDLGGGTGLSSIVAASIAKAVICTDIGNDILSLCQKNISTHRHLYHDSTVIVRELDWMEENLSTHGDRPFSWSDVDLELYNSVDVIIAADVIYDDKLTDAFFKTIYKLMRQRPGRKVVIALERRLNFTLSDLDISCPAYDYYISCLDQLKSFSDNSSVHFFVSQVENIQQHFYHERSKYLELWQISSYVAEKRKSSKRDFDSDLNDLVGL